MSDEETAGFMAETVHRTLEVDRAVPPDELQIVSQSLMQYLSHSGTEADGPDRLGGGQFTCPTHRWKLRNSLSMGWGRDP